MFSPSDVRFNMHLENVIKMKIAFLVFIKKIKPNEVCCSYIFNRSCL